MTLIKLATTIQDVARVSGVSTATVSRALSNPDRVRESTRARIDEAVRVTGYTPNQSARSLRQKTARTILVALPDIRNSFFSIILDSIEREAAARGYGVLVSNRFSDDPGRRMRDYFLSNRVDGLLLFDGSVDLEQLMVLTGHPAPVPLVVACEEIPLAPFHTVKTDNAYAAERATRHLISLGHRRIGHITGPFGNVLTGQRESGFRKAMADAGLDMRDDWLFGGTFEMEAGLSAASQFLALEDRPTALFVANDECALGFLSAIRRHGLSCPDDVSVVGFDDLDISAHMFPPLTTMRQPREALGRIAAGALIDVIEGQPQSRLPMNMVLSSELIVRGSTAPPSVSTNNRP
ncbi:MAG: LacI family DNA-binding transcriptional regulator [Candidatus Devosia phytovorans]|uniref:LacI family DNA-binding transcriptional regulator n=1 Tax=Candidatus Devosia phytovorans TaxID=3121372 RepID=A0AAJ5VZI1_9HYPH|nr:LacI family DNA-binding transcriptional regulator [Devosia sp.]WEK06393.1 MAG: LacI family DNA-binding transcriptional regulator [Devosia sp.]